LVKEEKLRRTGEFQQNLVYNLPGQLIVDKTARIKI
jgi:hypothetical protein